MSNDSFPTVYPRYWKSKRAELEFKSALLDLTPTGTKYFDSDMALIGALKAVTFRSAGKRSSEKPTPLAKKVIEMTEAVAKKHDLSFPEILQFLAEALSLDAAYRVRAERRGRRKIRPLFPKAKTSK